MTEKDEIAIVGVGCRFPGADNVEEYLRVLKNGENHVKEVPRDRWNIDAFYDPDRNAPGKTYVRTAGFIKRIDEWDNRFYGINDMEAELVDPQQRIVLDCVHMALEDGGITRTDIEGSNTGVYIGSMTNDYKGQVLDGTSLNSAYSVTGTHISIISARVSYTYNLCGPAMTLDTACSSSLVAIDVASQAIHSGKCDLAICGGVNILMDPYLFIALTKAGMLSPSGQCKTFTKDADGYARGEGCGIVLLKSLKHALRDGNKIWGTIRTGTNQDGHVASPITAPSGLQQERLITQVYKGNDVDKSRIRVIEAHGTGTVIGDPTEVNALGSHFGKKANASDNVYIGSVKTNIGHLEAAAGVAGLIKVLLMIKHDTIFPSLWYRTDNENPRIKLSEYGFVVPTKCFPWKRSGTEKRLACVNSFGFGGTNAHAIVEEFEQLAECHFGSPLPYIIVISAIDKIALVENVRDTCETLKSQVYDLKALSYTSTQKRDHRPYRKAFFGNNQDEIIAACTSFLNSTEEASPSVDTKRVIFVFCGVGTGWTGMCSSLMKIDPFRQAIGEVDRYLISLGGCKISDKFLHSVDILSDPMIAHIAIFACQVGLCALWKQYGIQPDVVIGQSVGEVAAAFIAGHVDLQTAVRIIFYRSTLLAGIKSGRMAVIRNLKVSIVEDLCQSNGCVSIAVYSSPNSCTVSGTENAIERLKATLSKMGPNAIEIIDLDVKCAYHSVHVEQAAKQLSVELGYIDHKRGDIPAISTVTGKFETHNVFCTSKYWEDNVRMPVLLSDAVKSSVSKTSKNIFLEIGPSPILRGHIRSILTERKNYVVIASMKKQNELNTVMKAMCTLYENGIDPKWRSLLPYQSLPTDIPRYQFRRFHHLYQSPNAVKRNQGKNAFSLEHMFVKQLPQRESSAQFKVEIDEKNTPFVFQHKVSGLIVLPGSTYADVAFEIGSNVLGISKQETSVSLDFLRPVRIEKGSKTVLDISTIEQKDELLFHAKHKQVTMCKGWVRSYTPEPIDSDKIDVECLKLSISNSGYRLIEMEMYELLKSIGFTYGPCFKLMKLCLTNGTESLTEIEVPDDVLTEFDSTTIHPCVLDSMMQSTRITSTEEMRMQIKEENISLLPVAIGELRILRNPEKRMHVFTRRINTTTLETVLQAHYNILLLNRNGEVIADLRNCTVYGRRNRSFAPCELNYRLTWHPVRRMAPAKEITGNLLVLTNKTTKNVYKEFEEFENVIVCKHEDELTGECYIANSFERAVGLSEKKSSLGAILLFIDVYEIEKDITAEIACDIHGYIKNNCMLLTELVKYMTKNRISSPLYVATQNTQLTFSDESPTINLVGEELWGFVRSIHLEFIHGDITLIDLQPSLAETKETLVQFLFETYKNIKKTKPELIICRKEIFGAQFTKVPRKEVIPNLRAERRRSFLSETPKEVLALRSKSIHSLVLTSTTKAAVKYRKGSVKLQIKSVCIHPLSIYPRTTSGIDLDQDIWQETIKDGHNLFGLEYIGFQILPTDTGRNTCKNPKTNAEADGFENKWELLCIHPREITTEMSVPSCCTISLREIPFYQPGLILYTLLGWQITQSVPKRSSVVIYSRKSSSVPAVILKILLQEKRNVHVIDIYKQAKNTEHHIDILISLEKIDATFFLLGRCRKIICLEESLPESVRIKITRSIEQSIDSYNAVRLLDKEHVSKCLSNVVSWLKKHHEKLFPNKTDIEAAFSDDVAGSIPCPTVEIIKSDQTTLPTRNSIDRLFRKDATYVVTGGLSGLGWEILVLLCDMGAGSVATMSRRECSAERKKEILEIERTRDCKIFCVRADVTDLKSVRTGLEEIEIISKKPIRGVFHGSGVLESKLLMNLEESQLDFVLKPKVIGTLHMHIATKELDLDYFVMASSIGSLVGSPGQSSYGAANSFLDTFMEWRRKHGLAGQSINWGALSVGMASAPKYVDNFIKRGFNLMNVLEIRSCLQDALMRDATNMIYSDINWDICARDYTNHKMERTRLPMSIMFEQAVSQVLTIDNDRTDDFSFDIKALQAAGTEAQLLAITQVILKVSCKVIGGDVSQIKSSLTLDELSFDSMSTVTFINVVHDVTGHRIAQSYMLDSSLTLDDIAHFMHDAIFNTKASEDLDKLEAADDIAKSGTQKHLATDRSVVDAMTPLDM